MWAILSGLFSSIAALLDFWSDSRLREQGRLQERSKTQEANLEALARVQEAYREAASRSPDDLAERMRKYQRD